jgi:uncharacterized protein involved in exopolysaccharide biosynthesis
MTDYSDEIDLRPYILAILKNWWLIAAVMVIFAAIGFGYTMTRPRGYQAAATLVLTRTRTTLALADRFPTVSEPVDPRARQDAIITIAQSEALAQAVAKKMGNALPKDISPKDLIKKIDITVKGDAMIVTADGDDPAQAAALANAWSQQMLIAINNAYSAEQPASDVSGQLDTARQAYEQAQKTLEDFLANNQIDLLKSKIDESRALFEAMGGDRSYSIRYYYDRKHEMEDLLVRVEALKEQVANGATSKAAAIGDALAIINARGPGLNANKDGLGSSKPVSNTVNVQLQILDPGNLADTTANSSADLDRVIQIAKTEAAAADDAIKTLSQNVTQGKGYESLNTVATQLRNYQSQYEAEKARQKDFTNQRDITLAAFQALSQKEIELKNTAQASSYINIASLAVTPEAAAPRNTAKLTLGAAFLGLVLGMVWVLGKEWWRNSGLAIGNGAH